jgi:hypothetical protein
MDPTSICRKARRLAGRQAELCQAEPEVVAELARGARLGVRECQFQFRFRRWNCSSHSRAFGRILQQGQCGGSESQVDLWAPWATSPLSTLLVNPVD